MKSCVFFGHRDDFSCFEYEKEMQNLLRHFIVKENVTQFYSGNRGNFDKFCARAVHGLKAEFPHITLTLVYSYIPQAKEKDAPPAVYDDSVYLLERKVPQPFAILETNKLLVDTCDYIISGVAHSWGGAAKAVAYAKRQKPQAVIDFWAVIKVDEK